MSKLYLQEKIHGNPGEYVIVGKDGFLTSGTLSSEVYPLLNITVPEGYEISDLSAFCNNNPKGLTFEQSSLTKFYCYLPEFGFWQITGTKTVSGDATSIVIGYIDVVSIDTYNVTLSSDSVVSTLNNTPWSTIKSTVDDGLASSYWSIGDRKALTLNNVTGNVTFNNVTLYAYIIGFDHNAEIEGPGVTFQLGFQNNTDSGKNLALVDANYGNIQTTNDGSFHMNYEDTYPGWKDSVMRTQLLNGSTNSLISCLPDDLVTVMTPKNIYTNNYVGSSSDAAANYATNITSTKDNIFLLSEYEIFGTHIYSSSYESILQQQYDYYKTNSKIKYRYYNTTIGNTCIWYTRSRSLSTSPPYSFCGVNESGSATNISSRTSRGVAPVFHIGSDIPTSTNVYISNAGSTTTDISYASSYITVGTSNTPYYSNQKILVQQGTVIKVYGKSSRFVGSKVGLKINDVSSGTFSSSTSSYSLLGSYTVNVTGLIDIKLVYVSEPLTYYVEINTSS